MRIFSVRPTRTNGIRIDIHEGRLRKTLLTIVPEVEHIGAWGSAYLRETGFHSIRWEKTALQRFDRSVDTFEVADVVAAAFSSEWFDIAYPTRPA